MLFYAHHSFADHRLFAGLSFRSLQKPGTATAGAGGKAVPASAQQSVSPPRAPSQTTTAQQAQSMSPQRTTSALGGEDAKDEVISKLKHTNASLRLRLKVWFVGIL